MEVGIEEEKAPALRKVGSRILAKKVQILPCSAVNMKWGDLSNQLRIHRHSSLCWDISYTTGIHILYSDLSYEAQEFFFPPIMLGLGRLQREQK